MKGDWKLNGKDLIHIGIFSAIYFVISFIGMILGIVPILWILMPGIVAIFAGIPFLLLNVKIKKPGISFLMGLITGILYYVTGQFTVVILVTFLLSCLASELVRFLTEYRSFWGNQVAFILFSYGMTGSPLPVWLFREQFFAHIASLGIPDSYIQTLGSLASVPMLIVLMVSPIVGGIIGSQIANIMFKKHFEKIGI